MKKYFIILVILGFGCFVMNSCQKSSDVNFNNESQVSTPYSLGCKLLPAEEYAKIPVVKDPVGVVSKAVVNLACPPVGNQGASNTCVSWGTTYAARSILWHRDHVAPYSPSVNIFSVNYVHYYIGGCTGASYVTTALSVLYNRGVCRSSIGPGACVTPTAAQDADARIYWINSYGAVTRTTAAIKAQLNAGFPVIVAGPVNNAFMYLASGGVLSTFSGSSLGGHCYCVVGYDDAKGAFKFMNSWGTGWASAGFGWIKYGYETTWWTEAYVMGN